MDEVRYHHDRPDCSESHVDPVIRAEHHDRNDRIESLKYTARVVKSGSAKKVMGDCCNVATCRYLRRHVKHESSPQHESDLGRVHLMRPTCRILHLVERLVNQALSVGCVHAPYQDARPERAMRKKSEN